MGGLLIIFSLLISTLLWADLTNRYIWVVLFITFFYSLIGFTDDYLKIKNQSSDGLSGKQKILFQTIIATISVSYLYFSAEQVAEISFITPFVKDLIIPMGPIIFILFGSFVVVGSSNAVNLTDGLDGLATGTSAIIGITLAIFAYLSGNLVFSDYLNILYIPNSSELVIFISSFVGACIGFLWYNSYPAKVFMGDTGSLALGGIIAVFAITIRKELLIPVFCGVFLIENLSVVLQVSYFKFTRKKYGEGKRIFLMSPIHHHYQKKGVHEAKIVARFWIVGILLAVLSIVTLKLR